MSDNISDKDKKDWKNFISSKDKVPDKDIQIQNNNFDKTRSIDLHGFTLEQANKKIEQFISKAFDENVSKLIIVTGKGIHSNVEKDPYVSKNLSILKYSIPEFISSNSILTEKIREITEAKIEDGGSGAFYIYLKKKK